MYLIISNVDTIENMSKITYYVYILHVVVYGVVVNRISAKPTKLEDDPNVPFLDKFIDSIEEDQFSEDRVLIHSVNKDLSQFHNIPSRKNGSLVFQFKVLPDEKKTVIVSGYDDNIRRSKKDDTEQRTYVILKKKSGSEYFITYVYVRYNSHFIQGGS